MLGQNQDCYGGCFNPQVSLNGDLADVRIWSKVLTQVSMTNHRMNATFVLSLPISATAIKLSQVVCLVTDPVRPVSCNKRLQSPCLLLRPALKPGSCLFFFC